jgi:hypothetical protein
LPWGQISELPQQSNIEGISKVLKSKVPKSKVWLKYSQLCGFRSVTTVSQAENPIDTASSVGKDGIALLNAAIANCQLWILKKTGSRLNRRTDDDAKLNIHTTLKQG